MRVLLVPNTKYPAALRAAGELATWLSAEGFEVVLASDDARACGLESFAVSPAAIGELALVVALGGDGTILKAVHLVGEMEVPLLGVNLGRLGFLSGSDADGMRTAVASALAGECGIERRQTLEAHVVMEGRVVGRYRALNEVALGRASAGRVINATISMNGTLLTTFNCDGVVVATATGSTAYSLSAGGPIVSPEVSCLVVTPVAPHTLERRAIVAGPSDVIEIALPDPSRRDACVAVDGNATPCRQAIESVTVRRCEHDVLLVKLDGRDFYEVVHAAFYGGGRGA